MLAWMNAEAVARTLETGRVTYWSRSRGKLWHKGEESGHTQQVKEIRFDCDEDVILLKVEQTGGIACHTGRESCFYRRLEGDHWIEVDGVEIDATGHYEHPVYGRMLFALLFSDGRRPGETMKIKLLRDGERETVTTPLRRIQAEADKIPPYVYGHGPNYVVVGGLVFQELTVPYLTTFGDWQRRGPPRLLIAYDREADTYLVTGKLWPELFEVRLLEAG